VYVAAANNIEEAITHIYTFPGEKKKKKGLSQVCCRFFSVDDDDGIESSVQHTTIFEVSTKCYRHADEKMIVRSNVIRNHEISSICCENVENFESRSSQ
jgi:hypothetical protein